MINDIIHTNWYEIIIVSQRAFFSLIALFLVTKLIGKKQVSELSLFDYVIGISIGNFAAEMTMNVDSQVTNGLVALLIFGIVATLVSYLTMKSIYLRRFFMGTPTIIVQEGKFVQKNLKRLKFDINDFLEQSRISGYFDVGEIQWAIMEANGKVSFLPKAENKVLTVKDINLKPKTVGLCANIIIDSKIMKKNLINMEKDEVWLKNALKEQGYLNYKNIILATLDINNTLNIYTKEDINLKNVLE
ncbi:MAG: DUF421 domain-containing protein [Bacilli bacterium]